MVLSRPEPMLIRHTAAPLNRRWIAVGVGAGFLLVLGMFMHEPSRRTVHVTLPASSVSPDTAFSSAEWDAYVQRAVTVQGESVPALLSSQAAQNPAASSSESPFSLPSSAVRAAPQVDNAIVIRPPEPVASRATLQSSVSSAPATTFIESATTCTAGVMALGLCSFEAGQAKPPPAKPATQVGSAADVAQRPLYREVTRGCREAAAALGLCTQ
jgi:hypothetical protein